MKKTNHDRHGDDEAVSPVIGVILMVAITVILAAVIGTFVLGLGEDVQDTAQAGVTFDFDGDDLTVNVVDPGNVDSLNVTGFDEGLSDDDFESGVDNDDDSNWNVGDGNVYLEEISAGTSFRFEVDDANDLPDEGDQLSVVGFVGTDSNLIDTYTVGG